MVIATPGNSQSNPVADWLKALPPLTRIWFVAAFLNANFIYFGVISPYTITWDLPALAKFQVWRLLTSFLFVGTWGKTGFNTLISLYMLQQYSARMEASPPNTGAGGTTPDYLFMLLIIGGAQLLSAPLVGMVFFGSSLYFGVLYVWCKINSTQQVAIWGFPMKAGMFPFALIALHLATGSDYMSDIVGLVSGHLYYFLVEVYPLQAGKDVLHTPDFLVRFCHYFQVGGGYVAPGAAAQGMAPPGRARPPPVVGGYNWGAGGNVLGAN